MDPEKLRHAVKTVLFNQVLISGPMVVAAYRLQGWRGTPCGPELPTFHWALMELAFFVIVEEVLFYYSHRYGSTHVFLELRLAFESNQSRQLVENRRKVVATRLCINLDCRQGQKQKLDVELDFYFMCKETKDCKVN